jgi:hypothetical protein
MIERKKDSSRATEDEGDQEDTRRHLVLDGPDSNLNEHSHHEKSVKEELMMTMNIDNKIFPSFNQG